MGWRDRDWARFNESERRVLYGAAALRGTTTRRARIRGIIAAVLVAAAAGVAAGQLPRHHVLIPALSFKLPHVGGSAAPRLVASSLGRGREVPLAGPDVAAYRSTYTLTGLPWRYTPSAFESVAVACLAGIINMVVQVLVGRQSSWTLAVLPALLLLMLFCGLVGRSQIYFVRF